MNASAPSPIPTSNETPEPVGGRTAPANPADAYPPTRPGPVIIVIALCLIVAGLGVENWPDVSAWAKSAGL